MTTQPQPHRFSLFLPIRRLGVLALAALLVLAGCDLFGGDDESAAAADIPMPSISPIPDTTGAVRIAVPDGIPEGVPGGPPRVTEFSGAYIPQDGQYAGILFVRETGCIPEDFNLLNQPPIPGEAFGCALTFEGVTWWYDPATDPFPFYEERHVAGGAVPVWFVTWPELQAAMADDDLTMDELEQLPSLMKGVAETYDAQLVFSNNQDGIPAQSEQLVSGQLTDGRSFDFFFAERLVEGGNEITDIEIVFD